MIALPWLILDITNSSTTTALVTMSSYIPTLIFGRQYINQWATGYAEMFAEISIEALPKFEATDGSLGESPTV